MTHKEYNSPDYFAQTLVDFLRSNEPKHKKDEIIGASYPASYSKGKVFSRIAEIEWDIKFEINGSGNMHYTLEVSVGDIVTSSEKARMKVERGPSGRISGNHWRNFYQKIILPSIKNAARPNQH